MFVSASDFFFSSTAKPDFRINVGHFPLYCTPWNSKTENRKTYAWVKVYVTKYYLTNGNWKNHTPARFSNGNTQTVEDRKGKIELEGF